MSDIEFVNGLIVKTPTDKTPDYVKAKMSFKVQELIAWLQSKNEEWVNVEIKASKAGKWYCAVDSWKPDKERSQPAPSEPQKATGGARGFDDDSDAIPFAPLSKRSHF